MHEFRRAVLTLGSGAGAALALAALPASIPASFAALASLVLPVALVLLSGSRPGGRRIELHLFLGAVGVRALVAIVIAYSAPEGFFALDDHRYALVGRELAHAWGSGGAWPEELNGAWGYYAWNALLFRLFGEYDLVPCLANAALGGLGVLEAYAIARELAGPSAARWAGALTAFCPSIVLWSSLNLKDAFALLAILLSVRGAQGLQGGFRTGALLRVAFGVGALALLRPYLAWLAAATVLVSWPLPRLRGNRAPLVLAGLLACGALAGPTLAGTERLREDLGFETLDRARHELGFGASAYYQDADVSTPARALRFLPLGLAYFLLAPAPWRALGDRQLLTLPEMLAWYALLPFVLRGIRIALRERFAVALPPLAFSLFATLSYALVESNLGTAYRHRAQVLALGLIFASVALARRRQRALQAPIAGSVQVGATA